MKRVAIIEREIMIPAYFLLGLLAVLFVPGLVWAAADPLPGTPAGDVKQVFDDVRKVVQAHKGDAEDPVLDDRLKAIIRPIFNFDEMSRRSLGAEWNKITPAERAEFVELFSDLLARTYLKRIRRNANDANILHISDKIDGEKAMVKSSIDTNGELISIDYRMAKFDSNWRIYDVVVENVGLVSNYRSEFPGIIQNEGFSGLLTRLRNKQIAAPKEKPKKSDDD